MKVLVAYATRHGATAGIAERVAAALTAAGMSVEARAVEDVKDVGPYDAVVLGGAAYMFHWLKPAVTFARRHRKELAARPVWLFSSGPLGTDLVDKDGKNVLETTRPKEFDELTKLLHPRGEQVFFGAYDPDAPPVGLGERFVQHMPSARAALPPATSATGRPSMAGQRRSPRSCGPAIRADSDMTRQRPRRRRHSPGAAASGDRFAATSQGTEPRWLSPTATSMRRIRSRRISVSTGLLAGTFGDAEGRTLPGITERRRPRRLFRSAPGAGYAVTRRSACRTAARVRSPVIRR